MNGAYRDIEDAREAGFLLYGAGISAWSGPKAGPFEINVPVCCGGVIVHPGDVVSASAEGVVVVPRGYAGPVAEKLGETLRSGNPPPTRQARRSRFRTSSAGSAHVDKAFEEGGGIYLDGAIEAPEGGSA